MTDLGFLRVSAATPVVHVANPEANADEIIKMIQDAEVRKPSVICFPELSISGYTCADLFHQEYLIRSCEEAVTRVIEATASSSALVAFGAPVRYCGKIYNCAILAKGGKLLGIVPKTYLPGNGEFYEPRWFESARVLPDSGVTLDYAGFSNVLMGTHQLFKLGSALIGVEICQDLWSPVPQCSWAVLAGAQLILNLSASNEVLAKHEYRKLLVSSTSSRMFAAYVYCSCGHGESTQDLVWAGSSLIYENGKLMAENERFVRKSRAIYADVDIQRLDTLRASELAYRYEGKAPAFTVTDAGAPAATDFNAELLRHVEPHPFVPQGNPEELASRCREILSAQVAGLVTRLEHIGCKRAVIGISGGLDSTLALLVTALAFDELGLPRENIVTVTMPGFGTTGRTYNNSLQLMKLLGTESHEISIVPSVRQHFADIGQSEDIHDLTYENCQARERTQILMDMAGKVGGIVIGTGDLSELALGWCTYNGDHMSMYGVNVSVPKTLVRTLVVWAANNRFGQDTKDVLLDIADTPISPELVPAAEDGTIKQKTEDIVGPYELHDFFLYGFFRCGYRPEKIFFMAQKAFAGVYDNETIHKWLSNFMRRFFQQQFKRSCLPDGPKVGSVSLSPRGDWRMPSDLDSYWKF